MVVVRRAAHATEVMTLRLASEPNMSAKIPAKSTPKSTEEALSALPAVPSSTERTLKGYRPPASFIFWYLG